MKKLVFKHKADSLPGAFGVSEERFMDLMKAVGHGVVESLDTKKKSETYEYVYETFKPTTEEELLLLGFFMGMNEAHQESHHSKEQFKEMLSEMTKQKHPLSDILGKKPKVHES